MKRHDPIQLNVGSYSGHRVVLYLHHNLQSLRETSGSPTTWGLTCSDVRLAKPIYLHLAKNKLTVYIIAHEAVHVAYCLRRRGCQHWVEYAFNEEEETIAYPAGDIAAKIMEVLEKNGYKVKSR